MSGVALVVFDLDGTLVDSAPGIVRCLEVAFRSVAPGVALPPLRPFIGPPVARMIPAIAPCLDEAQHRAVLAAFRSAYDGGGYADTAPMPGAREAVEDLRAAGLPVALATYKPLGPTRSVLRVVGLEHAMVTIRCVDGPGRAFRDKSEMLESVAVELGVRPEASVYVGDTRMDVEAAASAGFGFVGVGDPRVVGVSDASAWVPTLPDVARRILGR